MLKIETAKTSDAEAISSLILNTALVQLRDEFSDDGWALFQRLLSKKTQLGLIKNKKFRYLVAINADSTTDHRIINGVLAVKEKTHLFHFFVDPKCQGKGIGKSLWKVHLQAIGFDPSIPNPSPPTIDRITVNSSDFSIRFYQKLGFFMESTRQQKNGVCYTPMIFLFNE